MSKARAKGTRWETELLAHLANVWPSVERAPLKGVHDRGDFTAVDDWILEAKAVDTPRFLEWARTCRRKADRHGLRWAVLWKGDRRTERGQQLVVLELATFLDLCKTELARGVQP